MPSPPGNGHSSSPPRPTPPYAYGTCDPGDTRAGRTMTSSPGRDTVMSQRPSQLNMGGVSNCGCRKDCMIEPRHSTAYLGPETGRWAPGTWTDVVEAAAGGLIDESHWVDLKQELPSGKAKHNTDLAKDLASLAVDGGLLVIGVEDVE